MDKSAECGEDGRLFQIVALATAKLITECAVGASNNEHRSIRRSKCAPTGVRNLLTVVSKVRWQLTEQRRMDQQRTGSQ